MATTIKQQTVLDESLVPRHSNDIRYLTDVNVNKLYQPWRSFASVINKCLTGKSSRVDSFRLSQAQMLWGFYHRLTLPSSSGKILCIRWSTKVIREAMK
uniref:Uncharacterized protein n=1 Tax=Tanacetum cinerariifolium TaxID=118510 RepID=A0A699QZ13_TANCI|nr:hypothetical protein [Tanacetum cinerariifolium]